MDKCTLITFILNFITFAFWKKYKWEDNSSVRGEEDPSNITSFSVTSHEPFPCDAKLERDDSRLKDTRCIGTVPLASRRVSFQARWRSQYRASKKGVRRRERVARGWRGGSVKRRRRNEKKRTKRPECDEIGGHGDDGIRRDGGERGAPWQLAQTNREWRDTYFVAHVFWHQPPWETSVRGLLLLRRRHRHDRCRRRHRRRLVVVVVRPCGRWTLGKTGDWW